MWLWNEALDEFSQILLALLPLMALASCNRITEARKLSPRPMFPEFGGSGTETIRESAPMSHMFEHTRPIRSTTGDFFVALFMPPPLSSLPHIPSESVTVSTTPHWQLPRSVHRAMH